MGILLSQVSLAETNTVFNFLRNDVSPRAAALAGSFVTITNDPNSIFYNPAALSTLETPMGSIGFFKHLLDINSGYLSYSQSYEGLGSFGAGIIYTNYGSFEETDEFGTSLNSTFTASDLALAIGYSNLFEENLHYGASVKFIYSSIAGYNSTGLAADIGLLYSIPETKVTVGTSIRNIGTQLKSYMSTKEELPLDFIIGASVVPRGLPLLLNLNFHKLNEEQEKLIYRFRAFTVGGEFTLSKVIQVRVGYDNEKRKDLKVGTSSGLAGFSGGVGIKVSGYVVDYSLSSLGKIGELHRFS
ncbi:MAG TPA: hypothetical protein DGH68_11355, partial [Bacteroidetes bacterium]|nr:hypothetical protein [Bacteroidota bacterium]